MRVQGNANVPDDPDPMRCDCCTNLDHVGLILDADIKGAVAGIQEKFVRHEQLENNATDCDAASVHFSLGHTCAKTMFWW
jgi:hypothetical protein